MPVSLARRGWARIPVQTGCCVGVAAFLTVLGCESLQNAVAEGDTRSISLHHVHTNEDLTITYKVNGRYDDEALKKINHILRDWRKDETVQMDPHLIDLIWDVYREVEATEPVWIICGYRSPATNAMLRRRSSGVAKFSQHMRGKAMDFYIPGVPLVKLREAGLRAQRGGVGFYPSSNFVHLDTGSVRHWPRMPEAQLARVLAKGPLTRVASNDKPAKASLPDPIGPLAKFLAGGRNEVASIQPTTAAAPEPKIEKPVVVAAAVPLPQARPAIAAKPAATFDLASAESKPVEIRPAQTASLVNQPAPTPTQVSLFDDRGFWQGLPQLEPAPTSAPGHANAPRRAAATLVAAADPDVTASLAPWPMPDRNNPAAPGALAYAPATTPVMNARPAPMGAAATRAPAERDTTVAVKRSGSRSSVVSGAPAPNARSVKRDDRLNDPWMRAMVLSPSAQDFMSTSLLGAPDYRTLGPYLRKPASSVMMTFSEDPYLGMTADKFRGSAVVFMSTVTYSTMHTAALR